ncbi:MAG: adenine phosphoribosyltransferase [Chitinispirillaceae bacterium]|nr:adenine phosphoribosyltransferase [Chitinispirillaceae bacterium]
MDLDKAIRKIPDFPKPGILFYDITSIFTTPPAFRHVVDRMLDIYKDGQVHGVVGIESRGFLIASCFALERKLPLVLARKKGKLPGRTISQSYALEYGEATLEIHTDDLTPGRRWLVIDDLIATGGTLAAVAAMIERQGAQVAGIFGIIGLPFLNYQEKIGRYHPVTLIDYHAE